MPDKTEAMRNAPHPTNVAELQSFLGLVQYYAKFIANMSTMLLQVGVEWSWDAKCDPAFTKCKSVLSSDTLLTYYDQSRVDFGY